MPEPIDILENRLLEEDPALLRILLTDRTTGRPILWATESYAELGEGYRWHDPITPEAVTGEHGALIMPRVAKSSEEQRRRSKQMAEVFTPSWLVNRMCNALDEEWLGRPSAFNIPHEDHTWQPTAGPVALPDRLAYILSPRLEITCGEAPFLASRYDTVTGEVIPLSHRIGLLDRKLRIVSEWCDERSWTRHALLALGSVYGYEWQGDNLLIAREALLATLSDYYEAYFHRAPSRALRLEAAEIISWNLWQMDGLRGVVPGSCHATKPKGLRSLFGEVSEEKHPCPGCERGDILLHNGARCRLRRWLPSEGEVPTPLDYRYTDILTKPYKTHNHQRVPMKFDFVIGNPPYQEEKEDNGRQPPVYDQFMDACYQISDRTMLITPGRFLFDAGQTPKAWNRKMLSDPHLKVLMYEQNSSAVFPNTDIKGGIAVTYHNNDADYGSIDVFTPIDDLNSILHKVKAKISHSVSEIIAPASKFDLDVLYKDHPEYRSEIKSDGKDKLLRTNIFTRLSIFKEDKTDGDIAIIGLISGNRTWRYVRRKYLDDSNGLIDRWKVLVPESNGSGAIGEVLSTPLIGKPLIGFTQTFIGIGSFETKEEAEAAYKYICGKFARTMLGVLKITQHNPQSTWKYVPLQDFTASSDIDWTKSVREIDRQLYDKYGLTEEERDFIETHVREME